jgi:hypothetical protein
VYGPFGDRLLHGCMMHSSVRNPRCVVSLSKATRGINFYCTIFAYEYTRGLLRNGVFSHRVYIPFLLCITPRVPPGSFQLVMTSWSGLWKSDAPLRTLRWVPMRKALDGCWVRFVSRRDRDVMPHHRYNATKPQQHTPL